MKRTLTFLPIPALVAAALLIFMQRDHVGSREPQEASLAPSAVTQEAPAAAELPVATAAPAQQCLAETERNLVVPVAQSEAEPEGQPFADGELLAVQDASDGAEQGVPVRTDDRTGTAVAALPAGAAAQWSVAYAAAVARGPGLPSLTDVGVGGTGGGRAPARRGDAAGGRGPEQSGGGQGAGDGGATDTPAPGGGTDSPVAGGAGPGQPGGQGPSTDDRGSPRPPLTVPGEDDPFVEVGLPPELPNPVLVPPGPNTEGPSPIGPEQLPPETGPVGPTTPGATPVPEPGALALLSLALAAMAVAVRRRRA